MENKRLLEHYTKLWQLEAAASIASTRTSEIYRCVRNNETYILKIFSPTGVEDEGESETVLRYYAGDAAVLLIDGNIDGTRGAQLLEYLPGSDLASMSRGGEDDRATKIAAELILKLHRRRQIPIPAGIKTLDRRFASLFARARAGDRVRAYESGILIRGARAAAELINSCPVAEQVLLHGDIHHGNIIADQRGEYKAIDPKGIIGMRAYDAANLFYNPDRKFANKITLIRRRSKLLSSILGISREKLLFAALAHGCLSASWFLDDFITYGNQEFEIAAGETLAIAKNIEKLLPK